MGNLFFPISRQWMKWKQQISENSESIAKAKISKVVNEKGTLFTIKNVKTLEIVKRLKSILDFNLF